MDSGSGDNIDAVDDAGDSAMALAVANGHEELRGELGGTCGRGGFRV